MFSCLLGLIKTGCEDCFVDICVQSGLFTTSDVSVYLRDRKWVFWGVPANQCKLKKIVEIDLHESCGTLSSYNQVQS